MSKNAIFITAAITGAIHTPSLSEYLPITPEQIIDQAVGAHAAGAAVVHIHARNPQTGAPAQDQALMKQILTGIKARCNVIACVTTGAGLGMSLEERLASVPVFKPEIASCNAGSFNFYIAPIAGKLTNPKFDWELPYVQNTDDFVFSNTFRGITKYVETMYANGSLPEFEVYDVGMINNIAYLRDKGVIKHPIYIQFVMGIMGGIPATVHNLAFMVDTAKQLLGDDFVWSCAAAGRSQFRLVPAAIAMGGHARVGLEDNLYLRPGVLAKSSAEQVTQIREIAERMGFNVASSDQARQILKLKGLDKVGF